MPNCQDEHLYLPSLTCFKQNNNFQNKHFENKENSLFAKASYAGRISERSPQTTSSQRTRTIWSIPYKSLYKPFL